jgi:hypothetical protein
VNRFQAGDWVDFEGADGWRYRGKVVAAVPRGAEGHKVFSCGWQPAQADFHAHAQAPQERESYLVEGGFGITGKQSIHWPVAETIQHSMERGL